MLADFALDCDVTGLNFGNMSFLEHLVLTNNNLNVRFVLHLMSYDVFAKYVFVYLPSQGNVEDLFQGLQNATSLKDVKIDSNPNLGGSLEDDNLLLEPGICSLVEVRAIFLHNPLLSQNVEYFFLIGCRAEFNILLLGIQVLMVHFQAVYLVGIRRCKI